jgi:hypothetical protein
MLVQDGILWLCRVNYFGQVVVKIILDGAILFYMIYSHSTVSSKKTNHILKGV